MHPKTLSVECQHDIRQIALNAEIPKTLSSEPLRSRHPTCLSSVYFLKVNILKKNPAEGTGYIRTSQPFCPYPHMSAMEHYCTDKALVYISLFNAFQAQSSA